MSKGLEALNDLIINWGLQLNPKWEGIIKKELKALEIIKKEPYISVNWYLEGTYEEYKNAIEKVKITEEEWNFVREVLL